MKAHITKRFVDALKAPESGRTKVYDDTLAGFGLVVHTTGKKGFFVEYGPAKARRRMSLGAFGPLTVDAARELAKEKLGEIAKGGDPLADREAQRAMLTFSEWVAEYLEGVRRRKKQPREDERFLAPRAEPKKHGKRREGPQHPAAVIVDRWRNRPIDQITRREIELAMATVAERGNASANRWLGSLRACLAAAMRSGLIPSNPAMGIEQFREAPPRARVLNDDEFKRVVATFDAIVDPHVRAAFVLLMDTGARKSEVLRARWDDIDLERGLWRIPSPKSDRPQTVPLGEGTVAFLREVTRVEPWFVPGKDPTKHRADLRGPWDEVREAASISDVTIHDLRRTFGLHVAKHAGLHIASKLLRHSDVRVTERVYAPLDVDDLRAGLEKMTKGREETSKGRGKGK